MCNTIFNFICVDYNGYRLTEKFIFSLDELIIDDALAINIIVVDNCSSNENVERLMSFKSKRHSLKILKSNSNDGYFPGLNLGIEYARNDNDGVIIVGNNDLEFHKDFIKSYVDLKLDDDVQVVCPDVITLDGIHQNPLRIHRLSKWEIFLEDLYYSHYWVSRFLSNLKKLTKIFSKNKSVNTNIDSFTQSFIYSGIGACYILESCFFSKHTKLDAKVFMWGEEALLSNQVHSSGGKIIFAPTLKVDHAESASVKKITSKNKYHIVKKSYKTYREYL